MPGATGRMPRAIEPMLAVLASGLPDEAGQWAFEWKWDGVRAITFWDGAKLRLQSRSGHDVTFRYPELQPLGAALGAQEVILDGEIVALDESGRPSFEVLQQRMGLANEADVRRMLAEVPVAYMIFDVIWLAGSPLTELAYVDRRTLLASLDLADNRWQTPPHQVGEGETMLAASRANGMEGVIAKRLTSRYELGRRSHAWLKIKNRHRQELVVGGWLEGEGRRSGLPGSLLVGYWEDGRLVAAGAVGSGLTDAMLMRLRSLLQELARPDSPFGAGNVPTRAHFVEPRLVVEVEFADWTRAGDLRAPTFVGLRDDRDPREVVRERAEEP